MIGVSFVGEVDLDGQIINFGATEEGLRGLARADVGRMQNAFIATFKGMLTDCMYYAPAPTVVQGDTWDLSRETEPGFGSYMLMMWASDGGLTMTDQATCTLESIGGDGTPTVVTFIGTQQMNGAAVDIPIDVSQFNLTVTGRAEFDPAEEIPLTIVRQTTMTLPAEMTGGQAGIDTVTTERITLTPPGVDAPAPPDDEDDGLPAHPGANDDEVPTTQPAAEPAIEAEATAVDSAVEAEHQDADTDESYEPLAPAPPSDATAEEPTPQPDAESVEGDS